MLPSASPQSPSSRFLHVRAPNPNLVASEFRASLGIIQKTSEKAWFYLASEGGGFSPWGLPLTPCRRGASSRARGWLASCLVAGFLAGLLASWLACLAGSWLAWLGLSWLGFIGFIGFIDCIRLSSLAYYWLGLFYNDSHHLV